MVERYRPKDQENATWLGKIAAPIVGIIREWFNMLLGKDRNN